MNIINIFLKKIKHDFGNIVRSFYNFYLKSYGVKIGNNSMISIGAKIDVRRGSIIIGSNCLITHGCVILSHDHTADILKKDKSEFLTVINDNVFIGVNSIVLPGVTIGKNSIIGAGSVVSSDIPEFSVACGNPANVIRSIT